MPLSTYTSPRPRAHFAICNETRPRSYGYQLRCLEPRGHAGPHRWTPELVQAPRERRRSARSSPAPVTCAVPASRRPDAS